MRDKILEFVKENGPSLPVELVSKIGGDSLIANAYLSDLVESEDIIQSEEKIGSVHLYYLPDQEKEAKKRLTKINVKLTPKHFQKKVIKQRENLSEKQKDFAERLKKIEADEKARENEKSPTKSVINFTKKLLSKAKEEVIIPKPTLIIKKPEIDSGLVKSDVVDSEPETFFGRATNYLRESKLEIINENIEKNECVVRVRSVVGPMRFHVSILEKKKVNKTNIAEAYATAFEKKMPVIILTSGEIAKTAKSYLREIGGLVRVKSLKK